MKRFRSTLSRPRAVYSLLLGGVVSTLFLFLLSRHSDLRSVRASIIGVDPLVLALTLPVQLAGFVLLALRTRILFAPLYRYSLLTSFKSVLVAFAGNTVLPFRIGDVARIGYLARRGGTSPGNCLAVVGLERLLDVLAVALTTLVLLPLASVRAAALPAVAVTTVSLAAVAAAVVVVGRSPARLVRLTEFLGRLCGPRTQVAMAGFTRQVADGLACAASAPRLGVVFALTLASWMTSVGCVAVWLRAFRLALPPSAPFLVVALLSLGSLLPSSPGFIGTYHYAVASALEVYGVPPAVAMSIAVVGHAVNFVPFTAVSIPVLFEDLARHLRPWRTT